MQQLPCQLLRMLLHQHSADAAKRARKQAKKNPLTLR
jgi:hypothetical protein